MGDTDTRKSPKQRRDTDTMTETQGRLFGVGAEFSSASQVYAAAEKCRDHGFKRWDVHTPFPVHGMDDAMGLGPSRLSFFSLMGACTGVTVAFLLIFLTTADYKLPDWVPMWLHQNYPLIVNGKPFFAFEPSIPIFFELAILCTALFTIGALLAMNMLPRWNHPCFNWDRFAKVTDDKFFIVIEACDPKFSELETPDFLKSLGAGAVEMIHEDKE